MDMSSPLVLKPTHLHSPEDLLATVLPFTFVHIVCNSTVCGHESANGCVSVALYTAGTALLQQVLSTVFLLAKSCTCYAVLSMIPPSLERAEAVLLPIQTFFDSADFHSKSTASMAQHLPGLIAEVPSICMTHRHCITSCVVVMLGLVCECIAMYCWQY